MGVACLMILALVGLIIILQRLGNLLGCLINHGKDTPGYPVNTLLMMYLFLHPTRAAACLPSHVLAAPGARGVVHITGVSMRLVCSGLPQVCSSTAH